MNVMQIMSMFSQLRSNPQLWSNPIGFMRQYGLNVPDNIHDPNAIIQHLMNTNQINQNLYNQARQLAQQFGWK